MSVTDMHARTPGSAARTDTAILGVTIALSAAANLGATWTDPAWMAAGLAATVSVPFAIHLWPNVARLDGPRWQRAVRFAASTVIVLTAAAVTMVHLVALLGHHWTTYAIGVSVELLGVLAAMARAGRLRSTPAHEPAHEPAHTVAHEPAHVVAAPLGGGPFAPDRPTDHDVEPTQPPTEVAHVVAHVVAHLRAEVDRTGKLPSQRATSLALGIPRTTLARQWSTAVDLLESEVSA